MKLTNPTDSELNAAFAEKVVGWHKNHNAVSDGKFLAADLWHLLPNYCCSADAVLPFLEKHRVAPIAEYRSPARAPAFTGWEIMLEHGCNGRADTFARACVIALLRAHGIEVELNK